MKLIKCPNCQKEISDSIYSCIFCGYELKKEDEDIESKIIIVPDNIQFIERSLNGMFKIDDDELYVIYSVTGFDKKKYIIKYNDIEIINLIVKPIPIKTGNLEITLRNGNYFKFFIKKSNLSKWRALVDYLKSDNLQYQTNNSIDKKTYNEEWHSIIPGIFVFTLTFFLLLIFIAPKNNKYKNLKAPQTLVELSIYKKYDRVSLLSCEVKKGAYDTRYVDGKNLDYYAEYNLCSFRFLYSNFPPQYGNKFSCVLCVYAENEWACGEGDIELCK